MQLTSVSNKKSIKISISTIYGGITMRYLALLLSFFLFASPTFAQEGSKKSLEPELGKHYFELASTPEAYDPQSGSRLEVLSFFWYNCGTCFVIEDDVRNWAMKLPQEVNFVQLPLLSVYPTDIHARVFFTLQALGLGPEENSKVFELFQRQGKPINDPKDLSLLAEALGLETEAVTKAYNSPEVQKKMDRLANLFPSYELPGVPSMIIGGKYRTDIAAAGGRANYLDVVRKIIDKEFLKGAD